MGTYDHVKCQCSEFERYETNTVLASCGSHVQSSGDVSTMATKCTDVIMVTEEIGELLNATSGLY